MFLLLFLLVVLCILVVLIAIIASVDRCHGRAAVRQLRIQRPLFFPSVRRRFRLRIARRQRRYSVPKQASSAVVCRAEETGTSTRDRRRGAVSYTQVVVNVLDGVVGNLANVIYVNAVPVRDIVERYESKS